MFHRVLLRLRMILVMRLFLVVRKTLVQYRLGHLFRRVLLEERCHRRRWKKKHR